MATLVGLGPVLKNMQAVGASVAMATPKKGGFRLVSIYRAVNKQIEKVPGVTSRRKAHLLRLRRAQLFLYAGLATEMLAMPVGGNSSRIVYNCNFFRVVYAYTSATGGAKRHGIFSWSADAGCRRTQPHGGLMISSIGDLVRMTCLRPWVL